MCPNTELFQVSIFLYADWIQENTKIPEKTPYLDTFHAVSVLTFYPVDTYLFKVNNRKTRTMVWNLFKANIKEALERHHWKSSFKSFWCLYCLLWTNFTHCSVVSIADFYQLNVYWALILPGIKKLGKSASASVSAKI